MSEQTNNYSLAMVPFVPWAVYNVAETKGFWKQQGINVNIKVHASEDDYVHAVVNNLSDFYPLPLASTLDFINMGIDLVYLGILDLSNGHKHLILKSSFLGKSVKGQTIALYSKESTTHYLVAQYLRTKGLKLSDVNLIYLDDESLADQFINGDLKLALAFRGTKERVKTIGKGTVVFTTSDYIDAFGITASRQTYGSTPQSDFMKFYQGRFEALKWIEDPSNWREFKSIVNEVTYKDYPDFNDNDLRAQLHEVRVPPPDMLLKKNQAEFRSIFDEFKEVVIANRILDEQYAANFTFEAMIHNQALIEALKMNL